MTNSSPGLLSGLRMIESSVLLRGFAATFLADLGATADLVFEGMRPGSLAKPGLGWEQLPLPIFVDGERFCPPSKAPTVGEHNANDLTQAMSSLAPPGSEPISKG